MSANATARFRELLSGGPDSFPLDEACLLISAHARPGLNTAHYLARLDALAGEILPPTFDGLLRELFGRCGFHGNQDAYYDPRNSFLDQVIERRVGIPITLSLVYIEVGQRCGLPLVGVGFPGHFLVKHVAANGAETGTAITAVGAIGSAAIGGLASRRLAAGTAIRASSAASASRIIGCRPISSSVTGSSMG